MRLTLAWLAGRYDEPPAAVRQDWSAARERSSIAAGSELGNKARSKATRSPGWWHTAWTGEGRGECVITLDAFRWKVIDERTIELLQPAQPGMVARQRAGNYAATVVAEDRHSGEQVIVSVAHMYARVEGRWFARAVREVVTWRRCARRWARGIRRLRLAHPHAEVIICADWNLSARRKPLRVAVRRLMRPAGTDLRVVAPVGGTHGNRPIDWMLTTFRGTARTHRAVASDHKQVVFTLESRRRP